MELLKAVAPEFAQNQMESKKFLFENEKYSAIPAKYKHLAGIAAAAVLGSETCTNMWVKNALAAGVTREEIVEAMMIARLMKQATVNDTIASALDTFIVPNQNS